MRVTFPVFSRRPFRALTSTRRLRRLVPSVAAVGAFLAPELAAQPAARVTSPKEFFGFNIGDDYKLANYDQFQAYWKKIDAESDRMVVEEIGKTAE